MHDDQYFLIIYSVQQKDVKPHSFPSVLPEFNIMTNQLLTMNMLQIKEKHNRKISKTDCLTIFL